MNKLKSSLVTLGVLFLLIGAIALVSPHASQGDSIRDVKVTNTTSDPVPTVVQGTTNIAGNVGINPSSNVVRIDSSANTVKLENSATPLLVHDVSAAPIREVVVYYGAQHLPEGQFDLVAPAFNVPPGKRWVIEYVNLQVQPPGYIASIVLQAPFGPALISYDLLESYSDPPFLGRNVSQPVKIYVSSGQTQLMFRRLIGPGGSAPETVFSFVFSGYLEAAE